MYCNKCGAKIDEESSFCHKCGTPNQNDGRSSCDPQKILVKRILIIIVFIILGLIVLMFGINQFKYAKSKQEYEKTRNMIFGDWQTSTGEIITFAAYHSGQVDVDEAKRLTGGIDIYNVYYLCEYFDIDYFEKLSDYININKEFEYGQKHDLILEINSKELYIDYTTNNSLVISDGISKELVLTAV